MKRQIQQLDRTIRQETREKLNLIELVEVNKGEFLNKIQELSNQGSGNTTGGD